MAVAQVAPREPVLLRAKQQGHAAGLQPLANQARAIFQAPERMLQFPVTHRRRPYYQRAIGDRLGYALVLLRLLQQRGCADRGFCFAKCHFIGIHYAQAEKPKVAHGTSRSANIERIARRHQHHAQVVGLDLDGQTLVI